MLPGARRKVCCRTLYGTIPLGFQIEIFLGIALVLKTLEVRYQLSFPMTVSHIPNILDLLWCGQNTLVALTGQPIQGRRHENMAHVYACIILPFHQDLALQSSSLQVLKWTVHLPFSTVFFQVTDKMLATFPRRKVLPYEKNYWNLRLGEFKK